MDREPVGFRTYQPSDAGELLALFRETVRRVNCQDYSPEQIAAWASDSIDPEHWAQRFDGRHTIVAIDDDRVVGFGEMLPIGHIDRFYVHADHQRRGIGASILAQLLEKARTWGLKRLSVEASITAKPFFEAHGFINLGSQVVHCRGADLTNYRMEIRF